MLLAGLRRLEGKRWQLETKFGKLPSRVDERLEAAKPLQITRWSKKILSADTLEGVLGRE